MQSNYSLFGSRLTIPLPDDVAAAYNRATQAFIDAQANHEKMTGSKWTPDQPIAITWTPEEQTAFDQVGQIINLFGELFGGIECPEEEMTSDSLIKM